MPLDTKGPGNLKGLTAKSSGPEVPYYILKNIYYNLPPCIMGCHWPSGSSCHRGPAACQNPKGARVLNLAGLDGLGGAPRCRAVAVQDCQIYYRYYTRPGP